jgi:carbon starvation protein CstA
MTQHSPQRQLGRPKRTYSRFGTFIAISLVVYVFVVVPIKLMADSSPTAALFFGIFAAIFLVTLILAFTVPVTQREAATYKVRPPMDIDPDTFDSTRDGVSW